MKCQVRAYKLSKREPICKNVWLREYRKRRRVRLEPDQKCEKSVILVEFWLFFAAF